MVVKVASTSHLLQWTSHPSSSSSSFPLSQTIASGAKRRSTGHHDGSFPSCRLASHRSSLFRSPSTNLHRSKSCELWKSSTPNKSHSIRRANSASLDSFSFSDEEFSNQIHDVSLRFNLSSQDKEDSIPIAMSNLLSIEMKSNKAGESSSSSMNKAFASMVFMIRELQSFTLYMREILFYEDLQEILQRVREEMQSSFVWLFQQVFSTTPTLMVYIMILLANFTVYSLRNNPAFASTSTSITTTSSMVQNVLTIDEVYTKESETSISGQDEHKLWNSILEEAELMRHSNVSRVSVRVKEAEEEQERDGYLKTEFLYRAGLSQDPNNALLLANYAQFLYIVSNDFDRAEEYFKRAVGVEPKDAEALSKYATFLWRVKDDLWAAEETFLEAIDADPTNSYYAANYAHFLWNTGGDETCLLLDDSQEDTLDKD